MRSLVTLVLSLCLGAVSAGTLEQPNEVDLLELEPKTSQLQLLVILEEDRVNTRQALKALYKKVNRYQDYISTGQASREAPNANPNLRPSVVLIAPREATLGEMQNLSGVKLAYSKVGAQIEVREYVPGLKAKPRKNGA